MNEKYFGIKLSQFLTKIVKENNWKKCILNIEIQPKMLGISGYCIDNIDRKISLRTKPTEELKTLINEFHFLTNKYEKNKWNKLKFQLDNNMSYTFDFIWDKEWQKEIDLLNIQTKRDNPNYHLPKWPWEEIS